MSDSPRLMYKGERPWPNGRMGTASIVGHTTHDSARIWVRTGSLGRFRVLLWEKPSGTAVELPDWVHRTPLRLTEVPAAVRRSKPIDIVDWGADTTHVVDWTNLEADAEYYYCLYWYGRSDSQTGSREPARVYLGHDRPRYFRTMVEPSSTSPISFGFYSCHQPFKKAKLFNRYKLVNEDMWDVFQEALDRHSGRNTGWLNGGSAKRDETLRFVIGGGDQVYADAAQGPDIWALLQKTMRRKGGRLEPSLSEMLSWYRDIYRGYWGFPALQYIYANFPNYMVWDDHELHDGWGSHRLSVNKTISTHFLKYGKQGLTAGDARTLIGRMGRAAKSVYSEYQHSHNPPTPQNRWDYSFEAGPCAVYVLDGRGHRNLELPSHKILGPTQLTRFKRWLASGSVAEKSFVFVVSAVPVFHLLSLLGSKKFKKLMDLVQADSLIDDLRDHWEDEEHAIERKDFLETLFEAAAAGRRICILSGDVHLAAAFQLADDDGNVIYQLTSSAITWNMSRLKGIATKLGVPERGTAKITKGKGQAKRTLFQYHFERLALYRHANFAILRADPQAGEVNFQLYGDPESSEPVNKIDSEYERQLEEEGIDIIRSHSIARIPLRFRSPPCE